ncbi:MAG: hypothetical protein JWP02_2492 [Acidimicrobiales bacterium]|nr:hypothetical protein [Acidimicrobiales bacterium]
MEKLRNAPEARAEEALGALRIFKPIGEWEEPPEIPLVDVGLEVLAEPECQRLLHSVSFGRVGVATAGVAMILPVNYAMVGDDVVFFTGRGLKLRTAQTQKTMTFQIDAYDAETQSGWSVLVVGNAEEVDTAELYGRRAKVLAPAAPGERQNIVRIRTDMVTGRRFRCASG